MVGYAAGTLKRVVMFSGGTGSWAAAKRVVARHGSAEVTLLFTDTKMEDPDLYRFLEEAAVDVGAELVKIADGRNIWEVFRDERFLGNSRIDPCSKILKRRLADRWLEDHRDPEDTIVYVGVDWTEEHRFTRLRDRKKPWIYEAPLCEAPYITKLEIFDQLRAAGIRRPRLYDLGFSHNNCGGGCVKAGVGHFTNLARALPEVYRSWELEEAKMQEFLGRDDISILRITRAGVEVPLTLRDLRIQLEEGYQPDLFEIGGCGCMIDEADSDA